MGAFFEAFFETIFKMLAELGLSKQPKVAKSKEISFKDWCLMIIGMAIFMGTINLVVSFLFHFFKKFF